MKHEVKAAPMLSSVFRLEKKALGWLYYVPALVLFVLLPVILTVYYALNAERGFDNNFFMVAVGLCQTHIPFFSLFLCALVEGEHLSPGGYELFQSFAPSSLAWTKHIFLDLYLLLVLAWYLLLTLLLPGFMVEFLYIIFIIAFVYGSGNLVMTISHSKIWTILYAFILCFIVQDNSRTGQFPTWYTLAQHTTILSVLSEGMIYLIIGMLCLAVSALLHRSKINISLVNHLKHKLLGE
ncbi:MAG: hypothetical protein Q4E09_05090 [Eubacteriales bacterium]|nr:hypothetical protein [Eubacteriales bacterium]